MTTGKLVLTGITKSYGSRLVLDDVSFEVRPGRLTGFVGGNGAGKTTTVEILEGLQKLRFLPEPQTDFIYAVIAEETGLLGYD